MSRRKLVLGYQDTPQGDDALALGESLAEILDLQPLVATVPAVATLFPGSRRLMSDRDLEGALALETDEPFAAARRRLAGLDPDARILAGNSPSRALHDLAAEEDAALIVIGSSHRGPIGRLLPGGVGRGLLHGSACAVAVAPRGYAADHPSAPSRLAVAFDGSAESWSAIETAIGIAGRTPVSITVLTVAEIAPYGYTAAGVALSAGELQRAEHDDKQRALDFAVQRIPSEIRSEGRLLTGTPGRLLAEQSEEFDLLLAGSRSYGALRRTALGSVATRLFNSAACPVLIIPRGVGADPLGLEADVGGLSHAGRG